ncbi:basic secretory protein-like protein [Mucilaginibacter celer]|uniref:Secretory protein n=1 Tax=Mucilaginibacter celer TaxID=2305508 RepID=A0A494VT35_9SPHI|nr:basic secretory protein-like protein [Mucilaginibacter celer]AYL94548.1 secretory protein [Mucilaginibacter celer]
MKKITILFALLISGLFAAAQDVYKQKGYEVTFISKDPSFSPALKDRLIKTFFEVYPKLAKEYNKKTSKKVTFVIDTAYDGVAATGNDTVVFSAKYMAKYPGDIDVVTHEVMHIVQAYGNSDGPGWLTEGIADYARNKFGVDNAGAKWALPAFKSTQNYDNAYRVTARFLVWIEKNVKPGLVKTLDKQLRDHTFTNDSWKNLTGKTVDELWAAYAANPTI